MIQGIMGAAKLATEITHSPDSAEAIRKIMASMPPGGNLRAAHLGNLAVSTLKWLILHAKSDDLKYQAAMALLALAPVQRKMEALASTVKEPDQQVLSRRLTRLVNSGTDQASEVLRLLEQAEAEAGLPANPRSHARNPLQE